MLCLRAYSGQWHFPYLQFRVIIYINEVRRWFSGITQELQINRENQGRHV